MYIESMPHFTKYVFCFFQRLSIAKSLFFSIIMNLQTHRLMWLKRDKVEFCLLNNQYMLLLVVKIHVRMLRQ